MLYNFEELRNEIRESFITEKFLKTLSLCKNYLKILRKIHRKEFEDTRDDLNFTNYYLSYAYKKINNIQEAIKYVKKAIKYAINNTTLSEARILLAKCYKCINKNIKAIRNYKQCSRYFRDIKQDGYRAKMIFNIAEISNKPSSMLKIIHIIEDQQYCCNDVDILSTDYISVLSKEYAKLVKTYSVNNQVREMFNLIHNIKNKFIKRNVVNMMNTKQQLTI